MKSFNSIGFGALNVDYLHKTAHTSPVTYGTINKTTVEAGGAAANTMCALSKFGLTCGVVGRVGEDRYSRRLIDSLDEFGVDYFEIGKDRRATTGQAQILVDLSGKSTTYINPGANTLLERRHIDLSYIKDTHWIHYSSFLDEKQIDIQIKMAAELKGVTQSSYYIDSHMISYGWNTVRKLLPFIHHVVIEDSVLSSLTDYKGKEAAKKLISEGCQTVGIIYSAYESAVVNKKESVYTKTKPFPVIDITGIKCAFSAGFIYGIMHGHSLKKTALLSHACMSFCAEQVGCRSYIPTKSNLIKRLPSIDFKDSA